MKLKNDTGFKPILSGLFLFAAFTVLIFLPLFQKGTFIDGELYKTVAFNYAINTASFWNMKYTITCMPFFCEQPPLYPFLLGSFYKIVGSHYLIDRFFTLLLLLVFAGLMKKIIQQLFPEQKFYYPLFLFLMVSVPVWCWSYVNQVIEPLVCVFTAAGILFFLKYLATQKIAYGVGFALALYLSFLSKGFQSCFLIVLPAAYFLVTKFSKTALSITFVAGALLGIALAVTLTLYQPAADWFACYYNSRLVLTMQNVGNTTDSHIEIIIRFFTELIVPFILLIGLGAYIKLQKKYPVKFLLKNFAANKLAVALVFTAFAGSFPYALSLVQRGFYLIPSFICFLLAILVGFKRYWLFLSAALVALAKYKTTQIAVIVLFAGSCFYFCTAVNSYKRDEALLNDLELISPYLSSKETVSIEGDLWNYFNLHSYVYRQKQINLIGGDKHNRFLIRNKSAENLPGSGYVKLNLNTRQLDLFVKR